MGSKKDAAHENIFVIVKVTVHSEYTNENAVIHSVQKHTYNWTNVDDDEKAVRVSLSMMYELTKIVLHMQI